MISVLTFDTAVISDDDDNEDAAPPGGGAEPAVPEVSSGEEADNEIRKQRNENE